MAPPFEGQGLVRGLSHPANPASLGASLPLPGPQFPHVYIGTRRDSGVLVPN